MLFANFKCEAYTETRPLSTSLSLHQNLTTVFVSAAAASRPNCELSPHFLIKAFGNASTSWKIFIIIIFLSFLAFLIKKFFIRNNLAHNRWIHKAACSRSLLLQLFFPAHCITSTIFLSIVCWALFFIQFFHIYKIHIYMCTRQREGRKRWRWSGFIKNYFLSLLHTCKSLFHFFYFLLLWQCIKHIHIYMRECNCANNKM